MQSAFLLLACDGAAQGFYGMTAWYEGSCVHEYVGRCEKLDGTTNNITEYSSIISGLKLLEEAEEELGFDLTAKRVVLISDSQLVVNQLGPRVGLQGVAWRINYDHLLELNHEAQTRWRRLTGRGLQLDLQWHRRETPEIDYTDKMIRTARKRSS